jgi:hypothetical protein
VLQAQLAHAAQARQPRRAAAPVLDTQQSKSQAALACSLAV